MTDAGYRAGLEELRGLYRYRCPVVLLMAMLLVGLERQFQEVMIAEDTEIVRAQTV